MTIPTRTNRWRGIVAVSLAVAAAGLLAEQRAVFLLSTVGVVFAAYSRTASVPTPALGIERRVDAPSPAEGDEVEVTVAITNEGSSLLFDCRVVDGVPPALSVVERSPRRGMVLPPGATRTFSYVVEAERGYHPFGAATAIVRDPSGTEEVEVALRTDSATVLDCTSALPEPPHRGQALDVAGTAVSDGTGSGIEFQQTRAYRRGDPPSRIDWKRYASTGRLTTVEFRSERALSAVVLVDARETSRRSSPSGANAVDASISAAAQLVSSFSNRCRVGLAAISAEPFFAAPASGGDHRQKLRHRLATHLSFSERGTGDEEPIDAQVQSLLVRLAERTQIVFVSPLCDGGAVDAVNRFESRNHPVTVVSPDVTTDGTAGERLATVERTNRIRSLRRADVPVVDWTPETPLRLAVERQLNDRL
ncbi:DUF58 domain-containing protein [Halobellus rufus]|uniref:DUF58 domain-containing protein n=1 Tax=Halobellus rufus TaxID=1448860 RepID=UPI000678BF32|nr:DUF58 domain-containing protein [Halobellus rufus]